MIWLQDSTSTWEVVWLQLFFCRSGNYHNLCVTNLTRMHRMPAAGFYFSRRSMAIIQRYTRFASRFVVLILISRSPMALRQKLHYLIYILCKVNGILCWELTYIPSLLALLKMIFLFAFEYGLVPWRVATAAAKFLSKPMIWELMPFLLPPQ